MSRTAHALLSDGRVWLIDPFEDDVALQTASALGPSAGVLQLLDRHNRDCQTIATRLAVPLLRLPERVPDTPFEVVPVLFRRRWREVALWWPQTRALIIPRGDRHSAGVCARPPGGRASDVAPDAAALTALRLRALDAARGPRENSRVRSSRGARRRPRSLTVRHTAAVRQAPQADARMEVARQAAQAPAGSDLVQPGLSLPHPPVRPPTLALRRERSPRSWRVAGEEDGCQPGCAFASWRVLGRLESAPRWLGRDR